MHETFLKQVRFEGDTFHKQVQFSRCSTQEFETIQIDEKDFAMHYQFSENDFFLACKEIIQCEQCFKDLKNNYQILLNEFLSNSHKVLLLCSEYQHQKNSCELHQFQNIRRIDSKIKIPILEENKCWIMNFPQYFKGTDIILSAHIFKAQVNLYFRSQKMEKQFKEVSEIVNLFDYIYYKNDNISLKTFLQIQDQSIIINYDYILIDRIINNDHYVNQITDKTQSIMLKAINSILIDQMLVKKNKIQERFQSKRNFTKIMKILIIQRIDSSLQKIEFEKQEQLLLEYFEQEEKQQEAKKEKHRKKRQQRKIKKITAQQVQQLENCYQQEEIDDLGTFKQEAASVQCDKETIIELLNLRKSLTEINEQRQILRQIIRTEWENYSKQCKQLKQ